MNPQKRLFEQKAKTFSFAAKLLTQERAEKIFTLYAFCRQVDDIADEATDKALAREILLGFQQAIQAGSTEDAALRSFLLFVEENQLEKKYLIDLLDGILSDCHPDGVRIAQEQDLLQYCYRVAGTVGGLLCPLLGVSAEDLPAAKNSAVALGMAMQLTNIARDIQEDAENNRIYLPSTWLNGQKAEKLTAAPDFPENDARPAQKKVLALAETYYALAWQGLAYLPLRSRLTVLLAAGLYRQIGRKILKSARPYWQGRVYLSTGEKIWHSLGLLTYLWQRSFWQKPPVTQSNFGEASD
jgi:phytoene synthase